MQEEEGFVLDSADGVAHVRVGRHRECVSCGAYGAARQAPEIIEILKQG